MYQTTYAGPVLIAKYSNKSVAAPHRCCQNINCPNRNKLQDSNYCPNCGNSTILSDKKKSVIVPSLKEVASALLAKGLSDESLRGTGEVFGLGLNSHVFFANDLNRNGPRSFYVESSEHFVLIMDEINTEKERNWFTIAYKEEIELISSLYEKVDVSWMFWNYQN